MTYNYSVLMSVYEREKPSYLRKAMISIYNQTIATNDFVLVCDGPLTEELTSILEEMKGLFGDRLTIYPLDVNLGLGNALNYGLRYCKNELVARMDSDDISFPERMERELQLFENFPNLSIVSGAVNEFQSDIGTITGTRVVPEDYDEILKFSRTRNPFNHPAVMFKKSHVESVGSYSEKFPLFEDYYLWIRLLMKGYKARNIQDSILSMRVPNQLYLRRGGIVYAKDLLKFNKWMKDEGWIGNREYLTHAIPHALVCLLPNRIRKLIYQKLRFLKE